MILGQNLYMAQKRFLDGVYGGLSQGIHDFKIGKSRQLGISTQSRALTLFWTGLHPGMRGYFVTYEAKSLIEAQLELRQMTESLPSSLGFPRVSWNRDRGLVHHGAGKESVIMFAAAGTKESKKSGSGGKLGVGAGINFVHATEVSLWVSKTQYEAFINGLSELAENRLYIWESTGRGYNLWEEIWRGAKNDERRQKTIFIGWWAKEEQQIARDDPDFEKYGMPLPTQRELERIHSVKEKYGYLVQPEQLAWYRRRMDPAFAAISIDAMELEEDPLKVQEQPWDEDEMFMESGSTFFAADRLTHQTKNYVCSPVSMWAYTFGAEFPDTKIVKPVNLSQLQLKIWEEPVDKDGVYIISADPSGGANEKSDLSCAQINRAYADGLDQVAEFAARGVGTQQFAWVLASLMGYYLAKGNDIYFILEINGTGEAVLKELRVLKNLIETGYLRDAAAEAGIQYIFRNVKQFMWTRADALHPSSSTIHWKTSYANKKPMMERFRDFVHSALVHIRSHALIDEMRTVRMDGDSIGASGNLNDDRVIAEALAVRCWEDRVRNRMSNQSRTRKAEEAKKSLTIREMSEMFSEHMLGNFFVAKRVARRNEARVNARKNWRGR